MENFRKSKHRSNRHAAIDGIISGGGSASKDGIVPRQATGRSRPAANRQLGDFSAVEGFHPRRTGERAGGKPKPQLGRQPKRNANGGIDLDMPDTAPRARRKLFKASGRKVVLKVFVVLIVGSLLTSGYLFGKGYWKARQIFGGGGGAVALDENVDPSRLRGEGDGRVNILLLGKGGEGHEGANLTDTLLIVSIDPLHKEAALLSIPRDLYVKSTYGYTKINAVYANAKNSVLQGRPIDNQAKRAEEAGLDAADRVVEDHLGIPIHYHVMIDFQGFQRAIDEVGGIEIDIKKDHALYEVMRIDGRRYVLDVREGRQKFDGFRALAYARSRMTSTRGDFDRGERQRLILMGLKDRVFSTSTFANPKKISGLMDSFADNLQSNLSIGEVMRLYELGNKIDGNKVVSIGLSDPPNNYVRTAMISGQSVVVPTAGVTDYSEIRNYVRNTLRDGFIRSEDAVIAVYNGTDIPGLAARRASYLKSYGYNVSAIADAPTKGYQQTILVDLSGGVKKYTKRYLEQRLKTTAVTKMPEGAIDPGDADFVIILGQNESNTY